MKKNGFTLIELLIVTVVIVTLMGIVFRLAGTGNDQKARAMTIERLQRIENALSGYYAAFGSYPPVPLQGRSRDIKTAVAKNGVQRPSQGGQNIDYKKITIRGNAEAMQIEAACRAQPVGALYPLNEKVWADSIGELKSGNITPQLPRNFGNQNYDSPDWTQNEAFQFGLLSFLLPRYQFMLEGPKELYDRWRNGRRVGQWSANNRLPCLLDGSRPDSWEQMQKWLGVSDKRNPTTGEAVPEGGGDKVDLIASIASQAVCARWMENFKGIISGGLTFYNVDTRWYDHDYLMQGFGSDNGIQKTRLFSSQGGEGGDSAATGSGDSYLLDGMTIYDGWGNEFYYYSEPPYQSYRLWSSGPNGLTFPPWLDLSKMNRSDLEEIKKCIDDDVVHMSN